ncbi:MAG TPA: HD domain-containing phosphohydrolase [Myxococcota bacterium]|nr:HD domain-containing phosphohydrolase [Myxococcota bacterium]
MLGEKPRVLIVDDERSVLTSLVRLLRSDDYHLLTADSPAQAIDIMRSNEVAVVLSDQMMPGMTGVELLTLIRQRWPGVVAIMLTGCNDIRVAADVVNRRLIHYFVAKPWDNRRLHELVRKALDVWRNKSAGPDARTVRDLRQSAGEAAFSLARAVDARDRYTNSHSENVAAMAQIVGRRLGQADDEIEALRIGGLLHDVGKIGIPDGVLLKAGSLTDAEFATIKTHPSIGVSILEPIEFPWDIAAIAGQHHENHDGTGYPAGLSGDEIAPGARIVHVVDAFEAMAADRVYRSARDSVWIESELLRCRGTQFDPIVIDAFMDELRSGGIDPRSWTRRR